MALTVTLSSALYIFFRGVFPHNLSKGVLLASFILLIILSQGYVGSRVLSSMYDFQISIEVRRIISFIFISMLFTCGILILRDIILLLLYIISKIFNTSLVIKDVLASGKTLIYIVIFVLCANVYGLFQAIKVPNIKEMTLTIPNLPDEFKGFKLVHLTDLHIGSAFDKVWLEKVVAKVNTIQADAVVITGDMIDEPVAHLAVDVAPLKDIQAKYGMYMSMGNHENYAGPMNWKEHFDKMGLNLLLNENVLIEIDGEQIAIVGIGDPSRARKSSEYAPNNAKAIENIPEGTVKILMGHQPKMAKENSTYGYDVQLAGHTHGGQIFLLYPIMAASNDGYVSGLYQVNDMQLYVSNGTGLWGGAPFRFGVDSEITLITLQ